MRSTGVLSLVVLIVFGTVPVHLESCKIPSCDCVKRGSFDDASLMKAFPNEAKKYTGKFTFSTPEISYINCSIISTVCNVDAKMAQVNLKTGKVDIGTGNLKNPYVTGEMICSGGQWFQVGIPVSLDGNILSSNVSCATPVKP